MARRCNLPAQHRWLKYNWQQLPARPSITPGLPGKTASSQKSLLGALPASAVLKGSRDSFHLLPLVKSPGMRGTNTELIKPGSNSSQDQPMQLLYSPRKTPGVPVCSVTAFSIMPVNWPTRNRVIIAQNPGISTLCRTDPIQRNLLNSSWQSPPNKSVYLTVRGLFWAMTIWGVGGEEGGKEGEVLF